MTIRSFVYRSILASLSVVTVSSNAFAQADDQKTTKKLSIEEVLVTAQRRSQSLSETPIAVTALSGDSIERRALHEPTDLKSLVPNLQVNDSTGGSEPNFTLRGVGIGTDYSSNQASPVGVYVDDAYLAFRATHGAQMFDLERLEVLRGPQGTLFGRNTTGGAINFITRKPTLEGSNGYAEIGYGNYNDIRVAAAAESTLEQDTLGVRAAIDYNKRDGFIENLVPGSPDLNDLESMKARIALRFQPSDSSELNLRVFYSDTDNYQPGVIIEPIGAGNTVPATGYSRANLDFFEVESENPRKNGSEASGAALTAKFELSDQVSIQTLTAYSDAESTYGQDVDGTPSELLETNFLSDYEDFSQEIRLVFETDTVSAQAGVYYGKDETDINNKYDFFGFLNGILPADPTLVAGGGTVDHSYKQVRESVAVFGQADFRFNDNLTLTAGLRYTEDEADLEDASSIFGDYDFTPILPIYGAPQPLNQSGDSDAVTGRLALSYDFDDGGLVYASYSRGYRAGTFNGAAYLSPTQLTFVEPEKVDAYEVGAKGRFLDEALYLAGAVYYYDYTDQHIQDIVGAATFLFNAEGSTLQGLELEAAWAMTENFSLFASLGLTDSEYQELTISGTSLSGNELPFAPATTANIRIDYTTPLNGGELLISPSLTYTDDVWFTPQNDQLNNQNVREDAYALIDLLVEWSKGDWTARLWGKNLAEKEYYNYGLNLQAFGFDYFVPGAPRTFGLSLRRDY